MNAVNPRWLTCALAIGALLSIGCASTPPPPQAAADPAVEAANAKRSDETVQAVLAELEARDVAAVHARFNARMKRGFSESQLRSAWTVLVEGLGAPEGSTVIHREQQQGYDVRVAVMSFERGAVQLTLSTNPETQELAGFYMKPIPKPEDGAARESEDFRSEALPVGSDPFVLDGILTLPKAEGPFPAVVLIHGSGPQDRDSTVGPNKPLRDIAEGLAAKGVATLRYHKRTFQHGAKLSADIGIDDEVIVDAVAAVRLLASRPEVDSKRIFVVGHSLGALLAPEIAVRAGGVAGTVLLAPPGQAPWDSVLMQLRYLETPEEELAKVEASVANLEAGGLGPEASILGAPAAYWKDWASRDGVAMAKKLAKPMLILRGDRDYQVTEVDIATWTKAFAEDPRVTIRSVPGANHLFIPGEGKPGPAEYFREGKVDQRVIEAIADFVGAD